MKQQFINIARKKSPNLKCLALTVGDEKAVPEFPPESCGHGAASCCHSRMSLSGIQNGALRWLNDTDVALSGYPLKTCGYDSVSCCHSRMSLSGIQNRESHWLNGTYVTVSGDPPETRGYDKKGFGLAEVIGSRISIFRFRIMHENS